MRVYSQSAAQTVFGVGIPGQAVVNHAGMKQELRIISVQSQSFVDRFCCLRESAILIQDPGQRVPCVNVVSDFKFLLRKFQSLRQLDSLIGIEQGELAIRENSI